MNDSSTEKTRIVGVIGGMGPEATVDFMSKVIRLTPASRDQDHIRMLVDNNPKMPDRQAAINGDDAAVRKAITGMARRLQAAGADFLVMPCNTAHAFVRDAIESVSIPFLHIIEETVKDIDHDCPEVRKVGVLATDACLQAGVYQGALEADDKSVVLPDAADQSECMSLISRIKAGDTGDGVRWRMTKLAEGLIRQGADAVIAGCTEIPLVLLDDDINVPLISSTAVLAKRTVDFATGALELPKARN